MMSVPVTPVEAAAADLAARIILESTPGLRGNGVLRGVRCHVRVRAQRVHVTLTDLPPESVNPADPHGAPTLRGAQIAQRLCVLAGLANRAAGLHPAATAVFVIPPGAIARAAIAARNATQLRRTS